MTPQTIIKDALLELKVLQSGEDPTAAEAQDALRKFNSLLTSGELVGVKFNHTTAGLTDTLPYPDNHELAFVTNLAVALAPQYGVDLEQATVTIAESTGQALKNYYLENPELRVDDAIHPYYDPNRYFPNAI